MSFQKDKVSEFHDIFYRFHQSIRNFPGCLHLELLQDVDFPYVYCTYSHWVNEAALHNYRQSILFKEVWSQTKKLFADKPLAFSLHRMQE